MDEQARPTAYEFGDFRVDAVKRSLLLKGDGRPLPLTARAFDTLLFFLEHPGELLDKSTLMAAIWPKVVVEENNLNQHISALRRVLGERPEEHRFIVTVPGRGYRFVAAIHPVTHAASASLQSVVPLPSASLAMPNPAPPESSAASPVPSPALSTPGAPSTAPSAPQAHILDVPTRTEAPASMALGRPSRAKGVFWALGAVGLVVASSGTSRILRQPEAAESTIPRAPRRSMSCPLASRVSPCCLSIT